LDKGELSTAVAEMSALCRSCWNSDANGCKLQLALVERLNGSIRLGVPQRTRGTIGAPRFGTATKNRSVTAHHRPRRRDPDAKRLG
jgi:hypothetical protein